MKIDEKCKCGAKIHVEGQPQLCREMHGVFLKAHEKCIFGKPASSVMTWEDDRVCVQIFKKAIKGVLNPPRES